MTVAPGFQLWREVIVEARDHYGMDLDVTVGWSDELRRLVVTGLVVRQRPGGAPVTTEAIRRIALQQFVRHSIAASVRGGLTPVGAEDDQPRLAFGLITADVVQACRDAGPVSTTLKWVALLYRAALAVGEAPTAQVRETFGISQSTAGAWVAAARRHNLLAESDGPGRAGG